MKCHALFSRKSKNSSAAVVLSTLRVNKNANFLHIIILYVAVSSFRYLPIYNQDKNVFPLNIIPFTLYNKFVISFLKRITGLFMPICNVEMQRSLVRI